MMLISFSLDIYLYGNDDEIEEMESRLLDYKLQQKLRQEIVESLLVLGYDYNHFKVHIDHNVGDDI